MFAGVLLEPGPRPRGGAGGSNGVVASVKRRVAWVERHLASTWRRVARLKRRVASLWRHHMVGIEALKRQTQLFFVFLFPYYFINYETCCRRTF